MNNNRSYDEETLNKETLLRSLVCRRINLASIIILYLVFMLVVSFGKLVLGPTSISASITSNASKILKPESTSTISAIVSAIASKILGLELESESTSTISVITSIVPAVCYKMLELTTFFSIFIMIVVAIYLTLDAIYRCSKTGEFAVNPRKDNKNKWLELPTRVLMGSLGISAIPTAISLVICAIYERLDLIETQMSGTEIYIAFAGISIIFISFLSALVVEDEIEEDGINTTEQAQESQESTEEK
jgi:hypothetical protein